MCEDSICIAVDFIYFRINNLCPRKIKCYTFAILTHGILLMMYIVYCIFYIISIVYCIFYI